jgi:hypothetical protein
MLGVLLGCFASFWMLRDFWAGFLWGRFDTGSSFLNRVLVWAA